MKVTLYACSINGSCSDQNNLVINIGGNIQEVSMADPYFCEGCEHQREVDLDMECKDLLKYKRKVVV